MKSDDKITDTDITMGTLKMCTATGIVRFLGQTMAPDDALKMVRAINKNDDNTAHYVTKIEPVEPVNG